MNRCRACLTENGTENINKTDVIINQYGQIKTFLSSVLQFHKNDSLPQQVCKNCNNQLKICVNFIQKCTTSYHALLLLSTSQPQQEVLNKTAKTTKKESTLQCHICGKTCNYPADLTRHMSSHSGTKDHLCKICQQEFQTKSSLNKHVLRKHDIVTKFECLHCAKTFSHQDNLKMHQKVHENNKKYDCHVCNKKFKANRTLSLHLKIHMNQRDFPCDQCEKAFVDKYDLLRHLKRHNQKRLIESGHFDESLVKNERLFQCEQCGKICLGSGDLKKHMRVHTGERPFSCGHCGKAFKTSSTLQSHQRIHTGSKPHICEYCGRSFTQSSNLRTHEKLHTGDNSYVCTVCDRGFTRKRYLDVHLRKHTVSGERT